VIPMLIQQLAHAMARLSTRLLPAHLRPWGIAMQHEVDAIERPGDALAFVLGCLGFSCQQALVFHVLRPLRIFMGATAEEVNMKNRHSLLQHPQWLVALCAFMATGMGLVFMILAGAPKQFLIMNAAALVTGFLFVGAFALVASSKRPSADKINLALGIILVLTSLFGVTANGATRWISLGGFSLQPSLLLLPVMMIGFARTRNALSTAGMMLAAVALAMQPDRAMSGALAVGMTLLALLKPERNVAIAALAATCGFLAALLQADVQPAMAYVDQIFFSSFDVHPLAGMAVVTGAALMLLPAITGYIYQPHHRHIYAVFGIVWLAIIVAAALGNYPTPLVGYGGSAIIGYVVSMIAMPRFSAQDVSREHKTGDAINDQDQNNLYAGLSYSL
jgi:hypothetical protein